MYLGGSGHPTPVDRPPGLVTCDVCWNPHPPWTEWHENITSTPNFLSGQSLKRGLATSNIDSLAAETLYQSMRKSMCLESGVLLTLTRYHLIWPLGRLVCHSTGPDWPFNFAKTLNNTARRVAVRQRGAVGFWVSAEFCGLTSRFSSVADTVTVTDLEVQEHYDEFFEEVFTELEDKVCVVTSSRYVVTSPPPHNDVSMVTTNACCQETRVKRTWKYMCSESNAVVDPGFPWWRRGANPQKGEVSNLLFGAIFCRKNF